MNWLRRFIRRVNWWVVLTAIITITLDAAVIYGAILFCRAIWGESS